MDSSDSQSSLYPMISPLVLGGDSISDDGSSWNNAATTSDGGVGKTFSWNVSANTSGGDALGRSFSLNTPATMLNGCKGKAFSPNTSTGDISSGGVVWSSSNHR